MTSYFKHPNGWRCSWCGAVIPDTDEAVHGHTRDHYTGKVAQIEYERRDW